MKTEKPGDINTMKTMKTTKTKTMKTMRGSIGAASCFPSPKRAPLGLAPLVALLCGSGAWAQAQNGVTLYGNIDVGVTHSNSAANKGLGSLTAVGSTWGAPRIGLRGTEDLGGGLNAKFMLEHRFNADTGAPLDPVKFWHHSWVELESKTAGAVRLGRDFTPVERALLKVDLTGQAFYFPALFTGTTVRNDNLVQYWSPVVGGLQAIVAAAPSEGASSGRLRSGALTGTYGQLGFAAGYQKSQKATGDQTEQVIGASYDTGTFGISATVGNIDPPGAGKLKGFNLMGKYKTGQHTMYASILREKPPMGNATTGLGLAYTYALSKRTFLYGAYSHQITPGSNPQRLSFGTRVFF